MDISEEICEYSSAYQHAKLALLRRLAALAPEMTCEQVLGAYAKLVEIEQSEELADKVVGRVLE
jgi:hypothetical protein